VLVVRWVHGDGTAIGHEILKYIKRNDYRVGTIAIDPLSKSDSNNPNTTYDKVEAVLMSKGYYLITASKDKESGVLAIKEHLKGPNNEPSLWFFSDLRVTIQQIEGWMYDKDTQKPQKKDDDMPENLYRALLLDTRWEELEDEDDYPQYGMLANSNSITGY
jgi:hypothetical protein